jgi:hypothetical protein
MHRPSWWSAAFHIDKKSTDACLIVRQSDDSHPTPDLSTVNGGLLIARPKRCQWDGRGVSGEG